MDHVIPVPSRLINLQVCFILFYLLTVYRYKKCCFCCSVNYLLLLVESASNVAGLGFNGFDEKGNEKWDLVTNIDIVKFEFGSIRDRIITFNGLTANWLKRYMHQ